MSTILPLLPMFDAALILASGLLALTGFLFIRRRKVPLHRRCMLGATTLAALFLVVYVTRWALGATSVFQGRGWLRTLYLGILGSHTVLALFLAPLVIIALTRALRGDFARHRKVARLALPVWLYVAGTGWVIYWMLHHLG